MDKVYKEYGGYFYVPMTQAWSLAVPVTVGCSWDRCLFCDLNHNNSFRIFTNSEIREKLTVLKRSQAKRRLPVRKIVLGGGNPFVLETGRLIEIIQMIREYFPEVDTISSFARADDILRKSREELLELKKLGMGDLSCGIESGSDRILSFQDKGVTVEENGKALALLESCGIHYSTYIMLGLGGREFSRENALETGKFLSSFNPKVITAVSLVIFKDALLLDKVRKKEFVRLRPREYILEERLLLEHLTMRDSLFNATHKTNHLPLKGLLPQHRDKLIKKIDDYLMDTSDDRINAGEKGKWRRWSVE